MYQLLKNLGYKKLLITESIPFLASMLFSDLIYKFGSFMLECIAFVATWFLFSWVINSMTSFRSRR